MKFLLFALLAYAQSKPLYFQANINGVKIIPQKFEYGLLDAEKIRIGDILIDATTFRFQLVPTEDGMALKFNWPAGLVEEGDLSVLNNNGKALWTRSISKNQFKVTSVAGKIPHLRTELAEFVS